MTQIQFNNYDANSKGLNIEGFACYDSQQSLELFEDNFKKVQEASYDSNGYTHYIYTSSRELDEDFEYFIEGTKTQYKKFLNDSKSYSDAYLSLASLEDLQDDVIETLEQSYYRMEEKDKIQKAVEEYGIKYICEYETFETRGYSQGDYAKVFVNIKEVCKLWGCEDSESLRKNLQQSIDNYFWDCPVVATVTINNVEFRYDEICTEGDCYYNWEREEFIQGILDFYKEKMLEDDFKGLEEQLEYLLPTELECN